MYDNYTVVQPEDGYVFGKSVRVSGADGYVRVKAARLGNGQSLADFQLDTARTADLIMALASAAHLSLRDLAADYEATPATLPAGSVDAKGWEAVTPIDLEDEECAGDIDRFRVPGGWIYTVCHKHGDGVSTVFVPEPK